MIYNDEYKFVYLWVPKVGSTSMLEFLKTAAGKKALRGYDKDTHRNKIEEKHADYFKFCVVRNPYTRMVYFWLSDCKQRGISLGFVDWMERIGMCGQRNWLCQAEYIAQANFALDKIIRFEDRISQMQNEIPFLRRTDPHWEILNKDYTWLHKVAPLALNDEGRDMILEHSAADFELFGYPRKYPFR